MILEIKKPYYLKFDSPYNVINGIYIISDAYSHDRLIAEAIELDETFTALGVTSDAAKNEFAKNYKSTIFYKISFANGTSEYFVPHTIIAHCNPDVYEYYNTMLTIDLGPLRHPEAAHPIGDILIDALKKVMGNTPKFNDDGEIEQDAGEPLFIEPQSKPNVYGKLWLTTSEYDEMVSLRKASRIAIDEASGIKDYRAAFLAKEAENESLKSRISALETIITLMP